VKLLDDPKLQADGKQGSMEWCMVCQVSCNGQTWLLIIPSGLYNKRAELFKAGHLLVVTGEWNSQTRCIVAHDAWFKQTPETK
jgi:hypothetical protein